ncbi:MAG: VanZ family protein [Propionivibrio sp.]|nr:VanZ family protein [Propionivibrio sp.]
MAIAFSRDNLKRHGRAITALLVVGILFGLFVGGAQPVAVGLIPSPWDKLAHASLFAVLAACIGLASGLRGGRVVLLAFAGALLVGSLDEWHQVFLPGRQAGWDDLAADAAGSLIGAVLIGAFTGRPPRT